MVQNDPLAHSLVRYEDPVRLEKLHQDHHEQTPRRDEVRAFFIEPGKLADLTVLDRDYFAVPDAEIKKVRSVLTVVDGKIVHDAKVV